MFSLLTIKSKWYTYAIILWAIVVSYSRIYLGVHYPGDIICGALLGILIGYGIYKGIEYFLKNKKTGNISD